MGILDAPSASGRYRGNWAATTPYLKGDTVNYAGSLYFCTTAHTSTSSFDATKFDQAPGYIENGLTTFTLSGTAWDTRATGGTAGGFKNQTGQRIFLGIRAGVISDPGQNGHIYLDIAPDNNGGVLPVNGWITGPYVAARNNSAVGTGSPPYVAGNPLFGNGAGLCIFVPVNWWFRLRTYVVPGYNAPQFVTDTSTPAYYQKMS